MGSSKKHFTGATSYSNHATTWNSVVYFGDYLKNLVHQRLFLDGPLVLFPFFFGLVQILHLHYICLSLKNTRLSLSARLLSVSLSYSLFARHISSPHPPQLDTHRRKLWQDPGNASSFAFSWTAPSADGWFHRVHYLTRKVGMTIA